MKPATANGTVTLQQIGRLVEGHPVTIRLPAIHDTPPIELRIVRETLPASTVVEYRVNGPRNTLDIRMSNTSKVVSDAMDSFRDIVKTFNRLFRLSSSK